MKCWRKTDVSSKKSNIVIIGAGALGKVFGTLLADQANVVLLERNPLTYREMKKGYFYQEGCAYKKTLVKMISSIDQFSEHIDILIFATKAFDLKQAAMENNACEPDYIFLPQNGLFDYGWMNAEFQTTQICRGVVTLACQETYHNQVTLFHRGQIYIGEKGAVNIARLFRRAGVATKIYDDSTGCIWAKLIFSSVMNPLPIMTQRGYGVLRDPFVWKIVKEAVLEGKLIAKSLEIKLAFDPLKLIERVRQGDLMDLEYKGSMFQDFVTGRKLEIEFITGELIRQARHLNIEAPMLNYIFQETKKFNLV